MKRLGEQESERNPFVKAFFSFQKKFEKNENF